MQYFTTYWQKLISLLIYFQLGIIKKTYFEGNREHVDPEDRAMWGNESFLPKKDTRIQGFHFGTPNKQRERHNLY